MAKLPETQIRISSEPEWISYEDAAIEMQISRTLLTNNVSNGVLNWGKVNDKLVVIKDQLYYALREVYKVKRTQKALTKRNV